MYMLINIQADILQDDFDEFKLLQFVWGVVDIFNLLNQIYKTIHKAVIL